MFAAASLLITLRVKLVFVDDFMSNEFNRDVSNGEWRHIERARAMRVTVPRNMLRSDWLLSLHDNWGIACIWVMFGTVQARF